MNDIKTNDFFNFVDKVLNFSDKQFDEFSKRVKKEMPDNENLQQLLNTIVEIRL